MKLVDAYKRFVKYYRTVPDCKGNNFLNAVLCLSNILQSKARFVEFAGDKAEKIIVDDPETIESRKKFVEYYNKQNPDRPQMSVKECYIVEL